MDCTVQKENTFEDFLISWAKYSTAIISFAESHKSIKELKRCFRDDNDDPEADSEYTHNAKHQCMLSAVCLVHAGSLTALRCLGYFLGAKQKKKTGSNSSSSSTGSTFIDVPGLLIEPPVCTFYDCFSPPTMHTFFLCSVEHLLWRQ